MISSKKGGNSPHSTGFLSGGRRSQPDGLSAQTPIRSHAKRHFSPLFQVGTGRGYQGPDPLCVYDPSGPDFFDAVIEENDGELPIALDSFHKINVSGGGGYDIHLPDTAADAKLVGEWHNTTFVNYLRICCACAGLPGLEGLHFFSKEEREYLSKDLLPF